IAMDMISAAKNPPTIQNSASKPVPGPVNTDQVNDNHQSDSKADDISKMIPGSWYETDQIIDDKSTAKNGTLVMSSWLFYADGSLKYTTKDFADMGTWNAKENKFNVTLYASGKRDGYISDINNTSMVWVSNDMIGGKKVTVTHHLNKKK
ncbi:MAG TPA: hypothetical protein VMZ69_02335, partial [Saprospiraceae bacterium]|nr:hypothetical protein [Saprospiraceae bacterium]